MICTDIMLALAEPLPQWLNFLAMAGGILLVASGTMIWYVLFRRGKPRKRRRRHHHREPGALNPTLSQTGGLPPVRKEENPDAPAPPP